MSWRPAKIAGVDDQHGRPIAVGEPANLVVIDPDSQWEVDPSALASRSRNTPFIGMGLAARARHTVYEGRIVVRDGKARA